MAEPEKKFTLRLSPELHATLSRMAEEDDRSLHSMVVRVLREAAEGWEKRNTQEQSTNKYSPALIAA